VQAEIKIARELGVPVSYMRPVNTLDGGTSYDLAPYPMDEKTRVPTGIPFSTGELDLSGSYDLAVPGADKTVRWESPTPKILPSPEILDKVWDRVEPPTKSESVRTFESGATRNAEGTKPDYEGFLSPLALEEFGKYMTKHRHLSDGTLRASDNWQKGIPRDVYMKSLWRHVVQLWKLHRGFPTVDEKDQPVTVEDACCAIWFNAQGYLFETCIKRSDTSK
jgi:hypothetical protein